MLAHTLPGPAAQFPGVPALAETVPGYTFSGWTGLLAPQGTPQPIIEKLRTTLLKVAATQEFRDQMVSQGAIAHTSTPEAFAQLVATELESMGKAARAANLRLE